MNLPWSPEAAAWLAAAACALPLILAGLTFVRAGSRMTQALTPWATTPALVLALGSPIPWAGSAPGLPVLRYGLDATGAACLTLASITWFLAGTTLIAADRDRRDRRGFDALFLLAMSAHAGAILTRHAALFVAGSSVTLLAVAWLVEGPPSRDGRRARSMTLGSAAASAALLTLGLGIAVAAGGTTDLDLLPQRMILDRSVVTAITVLLAGGALAAAAVPLHGWLPLAMTTSPLPVAIVLAGTLQTVGVLAWLRLLPLGHVALNQWGVPTVLLGVAATFYGTVAGVVQKDARAALGYSSVAHLGFVTAGVGFMLVVPGSVPVVSMAVCAFLLQHGLARGALVLTFRALGSRAPHPATRGAVWCGLAGLTLTLVGVPFTGGAAVYGQLWSGIAASRLPSASGLVAMLTLAMAGTTALTIRIAWLAASRASWADGGGSDGARAGRWEVLAPWFLATCAAIAAPWSVLGPFVSQSQFGWTGGVRSVATGAAAVALIAWLTRVGLWTWKPDIPPGDLWCPIATALGRAWSGIDTRPGPDRPPLPPNGPVD